MCWFQIFPLSCHRLFSQKLSAFIISNWEFLICVQIGKTTQINFQKGHKAMRKLNWFTQWRNTIIGCETWQKLKLQIWRQKLSWSLTILSSISNCFWDLRKSLNSHFFLCIQNYHDRMVSWEKYHLKSCRARSAVLTYSTKNP